MTIKRGDRLWATTAHGNEIEVIADSGPEPEGKSRGWCHACGNTHSFPIVWVRILRQGRPADRVPWPLESVRPVDERKGRTA